MNSKHLVNVGNRLTVKLQYTCNPAQCVENLSPEYVINQSGVFQVKLISIRTINGFGNIYHNYIFVRFNKLRSNNDLTYVNFTSRDLGVTNIRFTNDDIWRLIGENTDQNITIDVCVCVEEQRNVHVCTFASLHEDTELTDFELRGTDGAVRVHRAVLAAASPVLRTMLSGAWRETAEGGVDVPDTTSATLQHLKDYLYLHTLPESGLEQLLLLACYYMMPDLEQKCVVKLVQNLSADNTYDMIEFATKHNVTSLVLDILECVQKGNVSVTDMRGHLTHTVNESK